jgi:hypothetical protein
MSRTAILSIDSRFAPSGSTSSDFTYTLSPPIKHALAVRMSSIELPNTHYTFSTSKQNTTFRVTTDAGQSVWATVTLPQGNYSIDDLSAALQTALDTLNASSSNNFSVSISTSTGKLTLANSTRAFKFDPVTITSRTVDFGLGYNLGFHTAAVYSGASSYTGEAIVDVLGDNYVYLAIGSYGEVATEWGTSKVFAKIILKEDKNAIVFDNGSNIVRKEVDFTKPTRLDSLRIRILDAHGEVVDLNGVHISLTLEVTEAGSVRS